MEIPQEEDSLEATSGKGKAQRGAVQILGEMGDEIQGSRLTEGEIGMGKASHQRGALSVEIGAIVPGNVGRECHQGGRRKCGDRLCRVQGRGAQSGAILVESWGIFRQIVRRGLGGMPMKGMPVGGA